MDIIQLIERIRNTIGLADSLDVFLEALITLITDTTCTREELATRLTELSTQRERIADALTSNPSTHD